MGQLTTINLMRHGEVDNPGGILYERLPGYHLSARGRAMAQMSADWLVSQNRQVTAVIASPLERAQESAQPVAKAFGLPVASDENLIEAGSHLRGLALHSSQVHLSHPQFWKYYRNPLRPSWGEPYQHILQRMRRAVRRALAQNKGQEIVLVSHQLPIWTLRRWIEGKPLFHDPRRRECALASLTTLHFEENTLVGLEYVSPAEELVKQARDVTPGSSSAAVNRGQN